MKHIIISLAIAATLSISCSKEDKPNKLDPDAMISIRGDNTATSLTKAGQLTPREVVQQATDLSFYSPAFSGPGNRGFIEAHRDVVNVRLLMWGTDIIDQFGGYTTEFIGGHDFVIRRRLNNVGEHPPIYDTIAYIPQSVINSARALIKSAYDSGDYNTVYDLFDHAFTFRPVNGEEWRALKAQGNN